MLQAHYSKENSVSVRAGTGGVNSSVSDTNATNVTVAPLLSVDHDKSLAHPFTNKQPIGSPNKTRQSPQRQSTSPNKVISKHNLRLYTLIELTKI